MRGDKVKQDKNRMNLNFNELYSNSPLLSISNTFTGREK